MQPPPSAPNRKLGMIRSGFSPAAARWCAATYGPTPFAASRAGRTRAGSLLVANPKGGVGKTPTGILVGGALAAARSGSVCIMEVSDDPGALAFRAEGNPVRGLGELVRNGLRSPAPDSSLVTPRWKRRSRP